MTRTQRKWTFSAIVGTACSLLGGVAILASAVWFYAGVSYAAQSIPAMQTALDQHGNRISVLEEANKNGNQRYAEILYQLNRLNDKVDRLTERGKP